METRSFQVKLSNTCKITPASWASLLPWQQLLDRGKTAVLSVYEDREEWGLCAEGGDEGRISLYTVYSECIVTCVCCQVLLNYIFVCNVETNVSFLYGGITGFEQSDL